VIPVGFDYARARSVRDALKALAADDGTKLLAGGHSLIPLLRFRLAQPARLLDVSGLEELRGIDTKGRKARIRAGTTYRDVLDSSELAGRYPLLREAVTGIGDVQVRNAGTVGGGLAHADPASDLPAVMLALGAEFVLRSAGGKRTVPAAEFFLGPFTTAMRPDELLYEIVLPPLPRGAGTAYVSVEQAASGYAIAGAAAVVTRSRSTVKSAVLALTGVADHAFLADVGALAGQRAGPDAFAAATAGVAEGREVNGDIHAPAAYRAHLAGVVARRALERAWQNIG
jgi:aerobic carbon-monoxide dehydrogenase medium subunit